MSDGTDVLFMTEAYVRHLRQFEADHPPRRVNGYTVQPLTPCGIFTVTETNGRSHAVDVHNNPHYCGFCQTDRCDHIDAALAALDAADQEAWADYQDERDTAYAASRGVL